MWQSFNALKIDYTFDPHYFKSNYSRHFYTSDRWENRYNRNEYIFHYTSLENARSILNVKRIYVTEARVKNFGIGVFMTALQPFENYSTLLENIYLGNPKYETRLECAFAIKRHHINAYEFVDRKHPSRDLWKCNHDIELKNNFFLIVREY